MALVAIYKNPRVILTTYASPKQEQASKYIKCLSIILISYYLVTFTLTESLLLVFSTIMLMIGLILAILSRPQIILDNRKKVMSIMGGRDSTQNATIHPQFVDKIQVKVKSVKIPKELFKKTEEETAETDARKPKGKKNKINWYYTQIFIKDPKKKKSKALIETFELEDIVQAHYVAQLVAAFCNSKALDVQGKLLPVPNSHIPTKYLEDEE